MKLTLVLLPLLLIGCTSGPTLVVMSNPKTGEMAQCQDDARLFGAPARVQTCAEAYESQGWVRATK